MNLKDNIFELRDITYTFFDLPLQNTNINCFSPNIGIVCYAWTNKLQEGRYSFYNPKFHIYTMVNYKDRLHLNNRVKTTTREILEGKSNVFCFYKGPILVDC